MNLITVAVVALILAVSVAPGHCIIPKMIAEATVPGRLFGYKLGSNDEMVSSSSFVAFGLCSKGEPFLVPISGGSGRGAVVGASMKLSVTELSFVNSANQTGTVTFDESYNGFFDIFGDQQTKAIRFQYNNVLDNGATLQISCSQPQSVEVMITVKDDSGMVVNATVKLDEFGSQRIELPIGTASETTLKGNSKAKSNTAVARFGNASHSGITVTHAKAGGMAMVNFQVRNSQGKLVHRTVITRTRDPPPAVLPMTLHHSEVDGNGDVVLTFRSIHKSQPLKVSARIGIVGDAGTSKECVDVSAIVEDHKLVVHNEWFRRCLEDKGLTNQTSGWDVVVMDASVSDPEDRYRVVAQVGEAVETGICNSDLHQRRKLAGAPTSSEITTEMLQGRKPKVQGRRLQGLHRKLLVHGYCSSSNPFPTGDFTNYLPFTDLLNVSLSHDTFARGIAKFATRNNVVGCGCVAHSQGGAACTHLYTYYFSCLDNPTVAGKRIQSLGTPYQGTPLGVGCGINYDLTPSGAAVWLSGIPSWSRSQVYYYTTSFLDTALSYDYCSLATDSFLEDPDDGVTEKMRDQLPDGNNMGHTMGQCHTSGMRDPAQYLDHSRNAVINAAAQY